MAVCIDFAKDFDIEIYNNTIYFYARHIDLSQKKTMQALIELLQKVIDSVQKRAAVYNGQAPRLMEAFGTTDIETTYIPEGMRTAINLWDDLRLGPRRKSGSGLIMIKWLIEWIASRSRR